jgi:hypothetical protein
LFVFTAIRFSKLWKLSSRSVVGERRCADRSRVNKIFPSRKEIISADRRCVMN